MRPTGSTQDISQDCQHPREQRSLLTQSKLADKSVPPPIFENIDEKGDCGLFIPYVSAWNSVFMPLMPVAAPRPKSMAGKGVLLEPERLVGKFDAALGDMDPDSIPSDMAAECSGFISATPNVEKVSTL